MQIRAALAYPFRPGHRVRLLVIPAALMLVSQLVLVALFMGFLCYCSQAFPELQMLDRPDNIAKETLEPVLWVFLGIFLVPLVVSLVLLSPLLGYYWELNAVWRDLGMESPPPPWKGVFKTHCFAGLHLLGAMILLGIPAALMSVMTLGLVTPYFYAVLSLSSRRKTMTSVFSALWPAMRVSLKQAAPLLVAALTGLLLALGYGVISMVLSWSFIGPVLVAVASHVTFHHLMGQVLSTAGEAEHRETEKPAVSNEETTPPPVESRSRKKVQIPQNAFTQHTAVPHTGEAQTLSKPSSPAEPALVMGTGSAMMIYPMVPIAVTIPPSWGETRRFHFQQADNPWIKHRV